MPACCVIDCSQKKSVKGTYQSFKFPENPNLRKKWVEAVMREKKSFILDETKAICKRHFTEDNFLFTTDKNNRIRKRMQLKEGAVPTLFMGFESLVKPKIVHHRKTRKSVDALQIEKNKLERAIKKLEDQTQLQKDTIGHHEKEIEQLKFKLDFKKSKDAKEFHEMEKKLSVMTHNVSKIFNMDQVEILQVNIFRK